MKWRVSLIPHDETGVQVLLNLRGRPDNEEIAGYDVETDELHQDYQRAATAITGIAGLDNENGTVEHLISVLMEDMLRFAKTNPEIMKKVKVPRRKRQR